MLLAEFSAVLPRLSSDGADQLRAAPRRNGYHTTGGRALRGDEAYRAPHRGEPVLASRASTDGAPRRRDRIGCGDRQDWWVLCEPEPGWPAPRSGPEHVPGVGAASLSLSRATARCPVGTPLDMGTSCGVRALDGSQHARRVLATEVAPRAAALARGTFVLNEEQRAEGVGFRFLTVRATGEQPSTGVCEDLPQPLTDPLGSEIADWLVRTEWLRGRDDAGVRR